MARLIKRFSDESTLVFDQGNFDAWCIFLTRPGLPRYAPKDWQYFTRLQGLAGILGANKTYADFVDIFDSTSQTLDADLLARISQIIY